MSTESDPPKRVQATQETQRIFDVLDRIIYNEIHKQSPETAPKTGDAQTAICCMGALMSNMVCLAAAIHTSWGGAELTDAHLHAAALDIDAVLRQHFPAAMTTVRQVIHRPTE